MRIGLAVKRSGSAFIGILSWASLLAKWGLTAFGDVETVTGASDAAIAVLAILHAVPVWMLIAMALGSTGALLYSLIAESRALMMEARSSVERLAEKQALVKASNDKAWAFSAEFHELKR